MLRCDAVEFAERAAAADLAVRLNIAEATVRAQGHVASTLRERLPQLWAWFTGGEVSTQNTREAAAIVLELPAAYWSQFEAQVMDAARTLTERHEAAEIHRGVWTEPDRDGMGWLHARLSTEKLAMVTENLDGIAFGLFTEADDKRTMAQLRADALADLLTATGTGADLDSKGEPSKGGVTVALTIPVLSLLGHSDAPALLEGVGPIDIETARRLCATAPSLTRLLTDPITGTVLQMDPRQYRPSAALKRWLGIQQVTCDFPGCGRRAAYCDLDHTTAWAEGGLSTADNLTHRCRKHHTMKHQTKWRVERPPGSQRAVWTSPTGYAREADPPPF